MHRLTCLVSLIALGTAGAPAQEVGQAPTLSVRTDLVTLAVMVVDRDGALVTGLRREHFTVYDNGERQTTQFFTSEDLPATIGLLVDSSGSMRGRRGQMLAVATAFVEMREPADEFFTLHFNEAVSPGLPSSRPFASVPGELFAALSVMPARGMTALYDAIARGLSHVDRGTRDRRALILVSDGGDNASVKTLREVTEQARRSNVLIYSITFADSDNRDARPDVLKTLTRETGGRRFSARHDREVTRAFAGIAEEIRSGYTLGFAPAETSKGGFRSIHVVVDAGDGRHLIARTRAGYYAGPTR